MDIEGLWRYENSDPGRCTGLPIRQLADCALGAENHPRHPGTNNNFTATTNL